PKRAPGPLGWDSRAEVKPVLVASHERADDNRGRARRVQRVGRCPVPCNVLRWPRQDEDEYHSSEGSQQNCRSRQSRWEGSTPPHTHRGFDRVGSKRVITEPAFTNVKAAGRCSATAPIRGTEGKTAPKQSSVATRRGTSPNDRIVRMAVLIGILTTSGTLTRPGFTTRMTHCASGIGGPGRMHPALGQG